jgi:hypothetical protein
MEIHFMPSQLLGFLEKSKTIHGLGRKAAEHTNMD